MTSLAFPNDPNVGQTYMAPGGKVWRWGGEGWICLVDSGAQVYYNADPPEDIAKYPVWFNTDTGDLMVVYQDVDSTQWIKIGTTGGGGGSGGSGGGATYLGDLNDVDTTGVGVDDVISWNGTTWVPSTPAGAGSIDNATDVDTSTTPPSANQVLAWDSTNWIPYTLNATNWDTAYTHSQTAHAPTDADNTAANETSHADVVQDGDFTVNGLMVRNGAGVYATTTNNSANWDIAYTHSQAAHAPSNADNTAANETSHSDVVVDGDFTANGFLKRTSLGVYTVDTSTYGQALTVEDAGSPLTTDAKKINFAGAGVVTTEPVADEILVTIDGGGGGSALEVEDEGVSLSTAVTKINFAGVGVTATEPVADEILVTIAGGAGVSDIDDLGDVDTSTVAPTVDDILEWDGTNWVPAANAGGTVDVPDVFTDLTDTPLNYIGHTGKKVVVNDTSDGLKFENQDIVYQNSVNFKAHATTTPATSFVQDVETTVVYGITRWDNGSGIDEGYDATTGIYTCPYDGIYEFYATVLLDNTVVNEYRVDMIFKKNTSVVDNAANVYSTSGTDYQTITGQTSVECVAGDEIKVTITNRDATTLAHYIGSTGYSLFTGKLLTPAIVLAPHGIDVGFSVNLGNVDQVITDTAPATVEVEWTEARYEKNCNYDFTNNRFVAPSAGIYQFGATLQLSNVAGTNFTLEIITSKGTFTGHRVNVDNYTSFLGHANIYLDAGDTAYVSCYASTDSSYSIRGFQNWSYFFGTKVSGTSTGIEYDSYDIGFRASLLSNEVVATPTTRSKIPFDTVSNAQHGYDAGGNFDTTNNYFICPVSGIYAFYVSVNPTALDDQSRLLVYVYRNVGDADEANMGFNETSVSAATTSNTACSVAVSGYCDAGDKIEANFIAINHVGSTTIQSTASGTQFGGHLVRATTKAECSFYAYLDADQTLTTSGAWQKINLNNTLFDYGSNVDTGTNRIDIPENGRYIFNFSIAFKNLLTTTSNFIAGLQVNSSTAGTGNRNAGLASTTLNNISNGSVILDLVKGDYVELFAFQDESNAETARGLSYGTYISGYRLVTSQDTPKITSDLSDVSSTMPVTNGVLMYDGTEYVPTDVLTENVEHSFRSNISDTSIAANSSQTKVGLSNASFDIGSNLDFTNDRFIVPVDGRYQFNATARLSDLGTGKYFQLVLYKNGAIRVWGSYNGGDTASEQTFVESQVQAVDTAVAGDYFELYALNTDSTPRSITGSRSTFSGHLVSPNNNITLAPHGVEHAFTAWQSGSQSIPAGGGFSTIVFDEIEDQTNLNFDTTTGLVTIPTTGWWYISGGTQMKAMSDGTAVRTAITIDGTVKKGAPYSYAGGASATLWSHVSGQFYFNAGDVVGIQVGQSDIVARDTAGTQTATRFEGHMISGAHSGIEYDSYDVAFAVYDGTGFSLPDAVTTKIDLDAVSYDKGNNWDNTNHRFIAPVDGIYYFNGGVQIGNLNDDEYIHTHLYKNATTYFASGSRSPISDSGASGQQARSVVIGQVELVAGDTVELHAYQNEGSAQLCSATLNNTFLSGHLIRATSKAECSFKVHRNSVDQTGVPISTSTVVDFTNAEWDKGNNFNLTSNQFVAPEKGRYIFEASAGTSSLITTDKKFYCTLNVNGTIASWSEHSRQALTSVVFRNVSAIFDLEKSDVVDLRVWHDDVTTEDVDGDPTVTYFSGYRLVSSQDLVESTNDLADVYDTVPVSGDVLVHDGTKYEPTNILFSDEVSFNAVLTSDQTLSNNTWTQLQLSSEEYDKGNNYNIDTYEFVSPIDGVYAFNASVGSADNLPADTELRIRISVNASVKATSQRTKYGTAETYVKADVSLNIELSAGDVVIVEVRQVSGGNMDALSASSYTQFSGYLISPSVVLTPHGVDHCFSVHKDGTNQVTTATGSTILTWSTAQYVKNVSFDFTNNQFVAPVTGLYEFSAGCRLTTLGSTRAWTLGMVAGSVTKWGHHNASGVANLSGATMTMQAWMEAGQTAIVRVSQYESATETIDGTHSNTWFQGALISGSHSGIEYDSYDVAFSAYRSSDSASITSASWVDVGADEIIYDKGGNYTGADFIAPVDGLYHFNINVMVEGLVVDTTEMYLRVAINDTDAGRIAHIGTVVDGQTSINGSTDIYMTAGDTATPQVYTSDLSWNVYGNATFRNTLVSGHLVRATTKAECSFNAVLSANQTLTVIGSTPLELDTTLFNYGNGFNTTLNRFVAPEDGRYSFNFSGTSSTITSSTSDFMVYIRKNGTTALAHGSRFGTHAGTYTVSSGSVIVELEKDDYIELLAFQDESTSETIAGDNWRTFLSGYRVVSSQDVARKTSDLTDVNAQEPAIGEALVWNGTEYVPSTVAAEAGSGITSLISTFLFMGS